MQHTSHSSKSIYRCLVDAGFQHHFKNLEEPPVESFSKSVNGTLFEIEFLTHDAVRGQRDSTIEIAGVTAQPLRYLTMSLNATCSFTLPSGKGGLVVSPGAWIFHKGLTFPKRRDLVKQFKDLYGIWYVASQLASLSSICLKEFKTLSIKHEKWFETFMQNLLSWMGDASPSDWGNLELQDPYGKLSRDNFVQLVESAFMDVLKE